MDHSLYRPEDFACDESYLRYYFKLDVKDISYWEHWIRTHPEKLDTVMSADQLIGFLSLQLPEDEFQHEYDRFTRAVAKATQLENTHTNIRQRLPGEPVAIKGRYKSATGFWLIMVSTLLVICSAWLFEYRRAAPPAAAALSGATVSRKNDGSTVLELKLEEGSLVRLQPGAELSWPAQSQPGKREVSLNGSAYFLVSRDPRRPFFVYCNTLVTHVLGTGFVITTGKHGSTVSVSVSSGKVEVYEKPVRANGVVLTPNQKAVYTTGSHHFETTLADHPALLSTVKGPAVFTDARLYDVMRWVEDSFGIAVDVENENLYNCRFSGSITGTGLYEVLNAICVPLHASYEVKGIRLLIRGNGCDER